MKRFRQAVSLFTVLAVAFAMFALEPAKGHAAAEELAIVSSVSGCTDPDRAASFSHDGDETSKWQCPALDQDWIVYDLGATKKVESLDIMFANANNRTYPIKIEVGNRAESPADLTAVFIGPTTQLAAIAYETFDIPDTNGRYVKISMTAPNSNPGAATYFAINETKIRGSETTPGGEMLLSNKMPSTSSTQNSRGETAAQGNDGNMNTRWMALGTDESGNKYPDWWEVDLEDVYQLTKFVAHWIDSDKRFHKYKIEVSTDGTAYTTVVDHTAEPVYGITTDEFEAEGRYVRISVIEGWNEWTSAYELQVFGIGKMIRVLPSDDIVVVVGTPLNEIDLPTVATAVYNDNSTIDAPVTWDTTNLNLAQEGTYQLTGTVDGTDIQASLKVIVRNPSVVSTVDISGTKGAKVPASGTATTSYSATVKDQYGVVMGSESVDWTIEGGAEGVTVDASGKLTIASTTPIGIYTVQAASRSNPSISDTIDVYVTEADATFYVSNEGDDRNLGAIDSPFKTIQLAVDIAQAGDTVYIRGGEYHQMVAIRNSGTAQKKIVVSSYPGEDVIIDGQHTLPAGPYPSTSYVALVQVTGSHVELRDLNVTNSRGRGVEAKFGSHILVSGIVVSHGYGAGIIADRTSYAIIENSEVFDCGRQQLDPTAPGWPGALMTQVATDTIIRGNKVHENFGEGLADVRSNDTVIEDNIVWDNLKIGIYIDNSVRSVTQRNIVYYTDNQTFWRYAANEVPHPSPGISINDETYSPKNIGEAQQVINNFVYNAGYGFYLMQMDQDSVLKNAVIANNTFVNTLENPGASASMKFAATRFENSIITNNVFVNANAELVSGMNAPLAGLTVTNNLWSRDPGAQYVGDNNLIGDPKLAMTGPTGSGELTADFFKLTAGSAAIDAGASLANVTEDFFGNARGASPDLGGHEYGSAATTPLAGTVALTGADSVAQGVDFNLTYGLQDASAISAQYITIAYDNDKFNFVGAASLDEGTVVQETSVDAEAGTVKLIVASLGENQTIEGTADILRLTFQPIAAGTGDIAVAEAELADRLGNVISADSVSKTVTVAAGQAGLEALIATAQAVHNAATEGPQNGQYPTGTKNRLQTAIDAARIVSGNSDATPEQTAQAIGDLSAKLALFQSLIITAATGDLNDRPGIDIGDVGVIAGHYGATSADSNWDSIKRADLNGDGEIGLYELAFIAKRLLNV